MVNRRDFGKISLAAGLAATTGAGMGCIGRRHCRVEGRADNTRDARSPSSGKPDFSRSTRLTFPARNGKS